MIKEMVVLLGPPGVGKSVPRVFLEKEGYQAIVTSELLTTEPVLKSLIDRGNLIDDDIVNDVVGDRLHGEDIGEWVVFDGYPRTRKQAINIHLLALHNEAKLVVLLLEASDETLEERRVIRVKSMRKSGFPAREDDKPKTHKARVKIYKESLPELLSFFQGGIPVTFFTIKTDGKSIKEVEAEVASLPLEGLSKEKSVHG